MSIEIAIPERVKRAFAPAAVEVRDFLVARTINAHTDIRATQSVRDRFRELIFQGGVPIVYANHQGHMDGMALAAISEYLRNLASSGPDTYPLKGLVIPIAASIASGDQSEELKETYDSLKGGALRKGFKGFPVTRKKDQIQFGMSRTKIIGELRPFIDGLYEGYGIALLPEGTVQGGRHPKGEDIEQIYGMQTVQEDNLIDFFQLINRVLGKEGKWPFFMPVGLHGSYRIMQSPETEGRPKPILTRKGLVSLVIGITGFSLLKIQANLGMPYTEAELITDRGTANWMEDFNEYAMKKVIPGIPVVAHGVYAEKDLAVKLLNF